MKSTIKTAIALLVIISMCGCKKSGSVSVNSEGLTPAITHLVPQSVLNEMRTLGMPINGGATPPSFMTSGSSSTYWVSPLILKNTDISSDVIGSQFPDLQFTVSNQNNQNLTISFSEINGPETGSGLGSYLVGSDSSFSIFTKITSNDSYYSGDPAQNVQVISGTLTATGIKNLYVAVFMLDNGGNTCSCWINNGYGRVLYDSDGFSPKQ